MNRPHAPGFPMKVETRNHIGVAYMGNYSAYIIPNIVAPGSVIIICYLKNVEINE
jgi:hypothetical protein